MLWEGKKPVFVTLVSTGQDGLEDPKTTKATLRGIFRIKSKHITATMDSNERSAQSGGAAPNPSAGELPDGQTTSTHGAFELRDVPYVQYFHGRLRAALGVLARSLRARREATAASTSRPSTRLRVFRFTDPPVPDGWHGINVEPTRAPSSTAEP